MLFVSQCVRKDIANTPGFPKLKNNLGLAVQLSGRVLVWHTEALGSLQVAQRKRGEILRSQAGQQTACLLGRGRDGQFQLLVL